MSELNENFDFKDKVEAQEAVLKGLLYLCGYKSLKPLNDTLFPMYDKKVHSIKIPLKPILYFGVPVEFVEEGITCIGIEMYKPIGEK